MVRRASARCRRGAKSAGAQVKHLLIISALTIVPAGCGLPAGRDVRACDTCMSRHPQEAALCEGPRQAYEVDTSTFQAGAAEISPPAGNSYDERAAASHPELAPMPHRPNLMPVAPGPNGEAPRWCCETEPPIWQHAKPRGGECDTEQHKGGGFEHLFD